MIKNIILYLFIASVIYGCGKVGPLSLPEDKIDKSVITYPCDEECLERLNEEKERQQSVILQTE